MDTRMSDKDQISVREFIERILSEREKQREIAAEVLKRDVEHLNRLRETMLTKDEYIKGHEQVIYRIEKLEGAQAKMIGAAAVVGALIGALINHFWK